jgi:hypothetical protein
MGNNSKKNQPEKQQEMVSFEMKKQQLNGKKEEDLPKTVVYG